MTLPTLPSLDELKRSLLSADETALTQNADELLRYLRAHIELFEAKSNSYEIEFTAPEFTSPRESLPIFEESPYLFHTYRRNDYLALFHPWLNRSQFKTLILTDNEALRNGIDLSPFNSKTIVNFDKTVSEEDVEKSRQYYSQLIGPLSKALQEIELSRLAIFTASKWLSRYTLHRIFMDRLYRHTDPRALIAVHFSNYRGYLDSFACNSEKPRVYMQHGHVDSELLDINMYGSTHFLFWGSAYERNASKIASERAIQTKTIGNTKFEYEVAEQIAKVNTSNKTGRKKVLIVQSAPRLVELNEKATTLILNACFSVKSDLDIRFKPHPGLNANIESDQTVVNNKGCIQIVDQAVSIYEAIADADIIIGAKSTSLIEAAAIGKITIQVLPELCQQEWSEHGLTAVNSESELIDLISTLIESETDRKRILKNQEKLLESYFGKLSGVAEDIKNFVESLPSK